MFIHVTVISRLNSRDVNDLIISLEKAKNDVFVPFLNVCGEVSIIRICLGLCDYERWDRPLYEYIFVFRIGQQEHILFNFSKS